MAVVFPVCRIPVSICCAKRRATSFTHVLEGRGTSLSTISRVVVPIFSSGRVLLLMSREWGSGREPSYDSGERNRTCMHAHL